MLFDALDRVLGSVTKIRLLRVLLHLTEPVSGREAQTRASLKSRSGVSVALDELSDLGILRRITTRGANLYQINRDHDLTIALGELFATEERRVAHFTSTIRAALVQAGIADEVSSIILYGSNARREADPQSDVDLLVIVRDENDERKVSDALYTAGSEIRTRYGLRISPYVLSAEKSSDRERAGDPFMQAVRKEGRVLLGEPLDGMGTTW